MDGSGDERAAGTPGGSAHEAGPAEPRTRSRRRLVLALWLAVGLAVAGGFCLRSRSQLLRWAVEHRSHTIAALAIKLGADPNWTGVAPSPWPKGRPAWTALAYATWNDDVPMIAFLCAHGAEVDKPSAAGWTPLRRAALKGSVPAAQALLEAGADPCALPSGAGHTALETAAMAGHAEMVQLLIDRGALREQPHRLERPALHLAALYGRVEVIRTLVGAGVDVDLPDRMGRTPLHWAAGATENVVASVRTLLELGADPNAADAAGRTPLEDALRAGYVDVIQVLREHGAQG